MQSLILKLCLNAAFSHQIICRYPKSPYLCTVFFIVLDLRLTKGWVKALTLFLCPYIRSLKNKIWDLIFMLEH